MGYGNTSNDGQPQARAVGAGRVVGGEQQFDSLRRYARSVVGHFDPQKAVLAPFGPYFNQPAFR